MEENQKARLGRDIEELGGWGGHMEEERLGSRDGRDERLEEVVGAVTDEERLGWWCSCYWEGGGDGGDIEFGRFGIGRRGEMGLVGARKAELGREMRDLVLKHCCYLGS
ncbi:hypothetical protein ACJRO7_018091 [Eucalyptus globulus]|uniref:Uncharacterized protein n=1 Tax=Eucalyptus globulus TaxID=34317 RepID=A0ABD3KTM3_EUCGL